MASSPRRTSLSLKNSLPWETKGYRTLYAKVPGYMWIDVTRGIRTEYRIGTEAVKTLLGVETPTPVVVYKNNSLGYDSAMMVLEAAWEEPLGAATEESLRRQGFDTMAQFRRNWVVQTRKLFEPLSMVGCVRVSPWDPDALPQLGEGLIRYLYGEHL